jgi:hypothetical protein
LPDCLLQFFAIALVEHLSANEETVNPSLANKGLLLFRLLNYVQESEMNPFPLARLTRICPAAIRLLEDLLKRFPPKSS